MPNGKGFNQSDKKSQPASTGFGNGYKGFHHGDGHDFNMKAKITNPGGQYADSGPGLNFNGAEKDSSIAYLNNRGKKGIEVRSMTGNQENTRSILGHQKSNHGLTAYNSSPIAETYKPATSNGTPKADAVQYKTNKKNR